MVRGPGAGGFRKGRRWRTTASPILQIPATINLDMVNLFNTNSVIRENVNFRAFPPKPLGDRSRAFFIFEDSINGGSPGALSHTVRSPLLQEPREARAGAGGERSSLNRREPAAGRLLDGSQRFSEGGQVALDQ